MTTSTCGRSRPRAATSVQSKMLAELRAETEEENVDNVFVRTFVGSFPCRE